ncbi:MAG: hypothetical protein LJE96_18050 [Deltaproteobacteria bacterium]|jgi:hypothetical protein|nr:hypothetical protein [Deltaproteobacteria bacterium]
MKHKYRLLTVTIAIILTAFSAISAVAADHKAVPVPESPADMTFKSLRGVQYCEVWVLVGSPETGITGDYFNTSNLNNSVNKMDTCPQSIWDEVNAETLKAEYGAFTVFKNGPRGWTMDSVTIPVGPVQTFDGLQTRWWGKGVLPKGVNFKDGLKPYKPLKSHRKSTFTFEKGKPVYILDDPEGTPWVMQAFGRIIDPALSYDALKNLGDKLKPAAGWKYRVVVLEKDLVISTPKGYNWIVQDELGNTYDACKEGACNHKP